MRMFPWAQMYLVPSLWHYLGRFRGVPCWKKYVSEWGSEISEAVHPFFPVCGDVSCQLSLTAAPAAMSTASLPWTLILLEPRACPKPFPSESFLGRGVFITLTENYLRQGS